MYSGLLPAWETLPLIVSYIQSYKSYSNTETIRKWRLECSVVLMVTFALCFALNLTRTAIIINVMYPAYPVFSAAQAVVHCQCEQSHLPSSTFLKGHSTNFTRIDQFTCHYLTCRKLYLLPAGSHFQHAK